MSFIFPFHEPGQCLKFAFCSIYFVNVCNFLGGDISQLWLNLFKIFFFVDIVNVLILQFCSQPWHCVYVYICVLILHPETFPNSLMSSNSLIESFGSPNKDHATCKKG